MKFMLVVFMFFFAWSSAHAKLKSWKAISTVEMTQNQIVIDGAKIETFDCPFEDRSEFAELRIKSYSFKLSCQNNYPNGIFLGEFDLVSSGGDAGDTWDGNALLFFREGEELTLAQLQYSTQAPIECEGLSEIELKKQGATPERIRECLSQKPTCRQVEKVRKWDGAKKKFEAFKFNGKIPQRKLKASASYLSACK